MVMQVRPNDPLSHVCEELIIAPAIMWPPNPASSDATPLCCTLTDAGRHAHILGFQSVRGREQKGRKKKW
ncbi:hypothetical protein LZ32DRAFT_445744 [Colletotrichum eremochloae]|nr:hypothetical protein LZ32DRAFT_445744 [Colletotrichum eremochloae]